MELEHKPGSKEGGRIVYSDAEKRWVWRCSHCLRQGFWDDQWSWFGSELGAELNRFTWVNCGCVATPTKGGGR